MRVRDALVSLAEKGLRRGPLFLAIGDKPRVLIDLHLRQRFEKWQLSFFSPTDVPRFSKWDSMKIYRARNPRKSPLWQCAHRYFSIFLDRYPEDYQPRHGPLRPVVSAVVHKFLDCGNLERGFARIHCLSLIHI